ncbi:MAG: imidazole glycerol phosphate synthase subunit HisH [Clostridia bacterium]|nr:imidazole glycerol phosphate synthase subunit HisH [Clostridia bacterium]
MLAVIDYGAGNVYSVVNALKFIGADCVVTSDPAKLRQCSGVIMPGVGSFEHAVRSMESSGLKDPVKNIIADGKPFLGICLGMQILFESSEESPGVEGLGIFKGKIVAIPKDMGLKVPHIGWNDIEIRKNDGVLGTTKNNSYVYFVHSFYLKSEQPEIVAATTEYGVHIHAAVEQDSLFACQFHPEKSGDVGLEMLRRFTERAE